MTTTYTPPLQDIRFALEQIADLRGLATLPAFEHADPETVGGLLEEYGRFLANVLAPLNRTGDQQGSRFDTPTGAVVTPDGWVDAYHQHVAAGWGSVPFPPEWGGGGFPWLVAIAMQEMLTSASVAFSLCPLLTHSAIHMLVEHGSSEQQAAYLPRLVTGEWTGTMNLTEPQAGSDLAAVRTKATPAPDGTWRISGQKIFITYGEHDLTDNIVHLVLARVPDAPPGTKGISCFLVPKQVVGSDGAFTPNQVRCVSIEHKMGIHASPTCVMSYDDAVGYLIGEANAGMRYMFTMMNNARLSVGLQGLSVAERAYQQALTFSQERLQGRLPGQPVTQQVAIIEHPDVRRMLYTMRSVIEAMRGLIYLNAWAIDMAHRHPDESTRVHHQELVELLTPVSKAWVTDMGSELARLATQVHGGAGFIEETGVAQHERDVRIAAIYEGTNGIQAIDLVGRKLPMRGGAVVREFVEEVRALDGQLGEAGDDLAGVRANLNDAVRVLGKATEWMLSRDSRDALAGATPYLRMLGIVMGGWVMARQAVAARALGRVGGNGYDPAFLEAKVATARFYGEQLLPEAAGLLGAVTAGADVLYAVEPKHLHGG